jgi:hypothetical protein
MREPQDIFVKEFYMHPVWDMVIDDLEQLSKDYMHQAAIALREDHDYKKGVYYGVLEALSFLRGQIKNHKAKG